MTDSPAGAPLPPGEAYRLLALPPEDLLKFSSQERYQASGPGGQKRNRVYSAIRVTHAATGLRASASEHREAARNLQDAVRKLRLEIALSASAEVVGASPENAKQLALGERGDWPTFRAKVNPEHPDFARLALESLLALERAGGEPAAAARALGTTTSAFIRFLKIDKQVWQKVQKMRRERGLHPLV